MPTKKLDSGRQVHSPEGWNDTRRELPNASVEVETKVSWCRHTHRLTIGVAYVTHVPEQWRYVDVTPFHP